MTDMFDFMVVCNDCKLTFDTKVVPPLEPIIGLFTTTYSQLWVETHKEHDIIKHYYPFWKTKQND